MTISGADRAVPHAATPAQLIAHGWRLAEATLATATTERTLVTHWFLTAEDDSANADEHFGSDARTLRFLAVALPTLIDQLAARRAIVVLPWEVDSDRPTLTVVAVCREASTALETRAITRLPGAAAPPFWRIESGRLPAPADLVAVAAGLRGA